MDWLNEQWERWRAISANSGFKGMRTRRLSVWSEHAESDSSRNAKEYYAESLKREDYYTEGQEIRGEWQGIGAERLGLAGGGDQGAFDGLCEKRGPGTGKRMAQGDKGNRILGKVF